MDKWTSYTLLQNAVTRPFLDLELNKKVVDYWDIEKSWKWAKFQEDIPMESLFQMDSIHLFPHTPFSDTITQAIKANGQFSIESVYSLMMNH